MGVIVILALWAALGGVGAAIGKSRGRPELGFFIGLLAGPIGWVLVLFVPKSAEAEAIEAQRRTAIETATATGPEGPRTNSDAYQRNVAVLDLLDRLHGLMQSGALTSDEYESQKRRLLDEETTSAPPSGRSAPTFTSRNENLGPGWYPGNDEDHEWYWTGRKWTTSRRVSR